MAALYISLPGDPAWWQAFAGVAQVLLALAIFWVTRKYVNLTGDMVKLQTDVLALQKQGEQRELYDRRVRIYDNLMGFLARFARDMKIEFSTIIELYRDTREAEFLFGTEVPAFIDEVAKAANELWTLRPDNAIATGDQPRVNRIHELERWLVTTAFEQAKTLFGRYLKLTDPGGGG